MRWTLTHCARILGTDSLTFSVLQHIEKETKDTPIFAALLNKTKNDRNLSSEFAKSEERTLCIKDHIV